MPLKFRGTFEELHFVLHRTGIMGEWSPEPNGVYMLRCPSGGNIHWASGSKSLWVDGAPTAVQNLRQILYDNLGQHA